MKRWGSTAIGWGVVTWIVVCCKIAVAFTWLVLVLGFSSMTYRRIVGFAVWFPALFEETRGAGSLRSSILHKLAHAATGLLTARLEAAQWCH